MNEDLIAFLLACISEDESSAAGDRDVLAQCAAKRQAVDLYRTHEWIIKGYSAGPPSVTWEDYERAEVRVKALAAGYSDRGGYREEWRPAVR